MDFINDLSYDKKDLSRKYPEEFQANYIPFIVDSIFSDNVDTVLYANEINKFSGILKQQHYDYYLFSIKKKKRYFYRREKNNVEFLKEICEYYNIVEWKGKELLKILSDEKIQSILKIITVGRKVYK